MSEYTKLKTNLKLAIQRLKLLEKKKTELSLKSRKEIADYIQINKTDRARIRVEHIIREDNYVEAMEMLEMYCDLLIARFGLIEKMKELDPGLDEAIATLLWASPRISTDIQEFKIIGDILGFKYGKKYAEACKTDALNNVNEKVKKRLGLEAPSKLLVEQYLIEIAKAHNVPFEPDQSVMLRAGHTDEELISLGQRTNELIERNAGGPPGGPGGNNFGSGGGGGGGAAAFVPSNELDRLHSFYDHGQPIGFNVNKNNSDVRAVSGNLMDFSDDEDEAASGAAGGTNSGNNITHEKSQNNSADSYPSVSFPRLPDSLPVGEVNDFSVTPPPSYAYNKDKESKLNDFEHGAADNASKNSHVPPYGANNFDESKYSLPASDPHNFDGAQAPPLPPKQPSNLENPNVFNSDYNRPPSYNSSEKEKSFSGADSAMNTDDFDLRLPSVPTGGGRDASGGRDNNSNNGGDQGGSVDFDELTRRFQNLKKK